MTDIGTHHFSTEIDSEPGGLVSLADEYCARGLWDEAVRECRRCLAQNPQHLRARVLIGWALRELGESDEAERILKSTVEEIQRNALLFSLVANIAANAGDAKRAELFLEIGKNLRATALETTAPPEPTPGILPREVPAPSFALSVLESLLNRFQAKPAATAGLPSLFSAEDRAALIALLKSSPR